VTFRDALDMQLTDGLFILQFLQHLALAVFQENVF